MEGFPGWTTQFELMWRQEQSRHASGRTRVKDFGTPIWMASYQSREMNPNEIDEWRARMNALENGMVTFRAWSKSRCWPILHPYGRYIIPPGWVLEDGFWNDDGEWLMGIPWDAPATITTEGEILTVSGGKVITTDLPVNFSIGDYIELNDKWLHQVVDVDGIALTLTPHLSVGVLVGQAVNVRKPGVLMTVVPGSVNTQTGLNGRGSLTFQATEARG